MSRRQDQPTVDRTPYLVLRATLCALGALVALICLNTGCQRPGARAYHETLMSEKRLLEDQLYDLAYEYEILEQKLHELEGAGGQVRTLEPGEVEIIPTDEPRPVPDPSYSGDGSSDSPAELPPPSIEGMQDEDLQPDEQPSPAPTLPEVSPPQLNGPPSDTNEGAGPTRGGVGHVTEIRINPTHTGGEDFDRMPGDDGVAVLIEPRGAHGEVLTQPGQVSVVVVDPAVPNDRARVARWDLSEGEISELISQETGRRGIQLQLPWPQERPEHSKLHLFVRYVTSDGRKLESDREFYIAQQGPMVNRWTPRSRQRAERTARGGESSASDSERRDAQSSAAPTATPASASAGEASAGVSQPPRPPIRQVTRPRWRPIR